MDMDGKKTVVLGREPAYTLESLSLGPRQWAKEEKLDADLVALRQRP